MPTCCLVEAFPPCQAICGRMTSCHLWLCGVACGLGLDFLSELVSPQNLGSSFLRSTRVLVWRLLQRETNKKAPLGVGSLKKSNKPRFRPLRVSLFVSLKRPSNLPRTARRAASAPRRLSRKRQAVLGPIMREVAGGT